MSGVRGDIWTVLSCLALAAHAAAGDEPLFAAPRGPLPGYPGVRIAVGDIDADGIVDLVAPGIGLGVVRGRADGSFAPAETYAAPTAVFLCKLGDVDGDGDPDVVTGVSHSVVGLDGVQVLVNDGDGHFTSVFSWTTGKLEEVGPLAVADFDGNGMADIAVARVLGPSTSEVQVFLATGGGSFAPPVLYPLPLYCRNLDAGDLDLDGDVDLALVYGTKVAPFLGAGDGTFSHGPGATSIPWLTESDFRLEDATGDGRLDAVFLHPAGVSLTILPGQADGSFASLLYHPLPGITNDALFDDLDGDGILDLITTTGLELFVERGLGDLAFAAPLRLNVSQVRYVAATDANLDGRRDLLGFDTNSLSTAVLLAQPGGSFVAPRQVAVDEGLVDVALADVDSDGRTDLLTTHQYPQAVEVRLQQRDGSLALAQTLAVGGNLLHPCLLNADAAPDLVISSDAYLTVALGVGDGTFAAPLTGFLCGYDVELADLTGDGKLDAVGWYQLNFTTYQLRVNPGDGAGHFSAPKIATIPLPIGSLAIGDLDGDGDLDVVTGSGAGGNDTIFKWLNDGTGVLVPKTFNPVLLADSARLRLADVDADGRLDLVAWGYHGQWCRGLAGAQFAAPLPVPGFNSGAMTVADVDGDGASDVLWSPADGATLRFVRGGPSGLAGPFEVTSGGTDVHALAVGDFDGDGRLDIATADHEDDGPDTGMDSVTLALQVASGPFADLGHALAGSEGEPQLTAIGTLQAGTPVSFRVTDAKPFAPATVILGVAQLQLPFKGGVLVPSPTLVLPPLPTDGVGKLVLGATWPAGLPSGLSLFLQAWIADAAGPSGFAASNGLSATTP